VAALLARQKGFLRVVDYVRTRDPQLVSRNGHETVVLATFTSGKLGNQAVERLRPPLRAERVAFGGLDPVYEELTRHSRVDLERAELLALPLLLALSLWVFRGLVAALLPLLIGGLTIFGTFLFLRIVDQLTGLPPTHLRVGSRRQSRPGDALVVWREGYHSPRSNVSPGPFSPSK
jgi:hypothetical protein